MIVRNAPASATASAAAAAAATAAQSNSNDSAPSAPKVTETLRIFFLSTGDRPGKTSLTHRFAHDGIPFKENETPTIGVDFCLVSLCPKGCASVAPLSPSSFSANLATSAPFGPDFRSFLTDAAGLSDDEALRVQLLEANGGSGFRSMLYARVISTAHAVVIVYDVNNGDALDEVAEIANAVRERSAAEEIMSGPAPSDDSDDAQLQRAHLAARTICLLGNKADLLPVAAPRTTASATVAMSSLLALPPPASQKVVTEEQARQLCADQKLFFLGHVSARNPRAGSSSTDAAFLGLLEIIFAMRNVDRKAQHLAKRSAKAKAKQKTPSRRKPARRFGFYGIEIKNSTR
jgi:hypothetical protein